jgi:hypothetical protein
MLPDPVLLRHSLATEKCILPLFSRHLVEITHNFSLRLISFDLFDVMQSDAQNETRNPVILVSLPESENENEKEPSSYETGFTKRR